MATTYQQVYDPVLKRVDPHTIKATLDDGTVLWIPTDPMNADYQQFQAWEAEGNQPAPDPAAPTS